MCDSARASGRAKVIDRVLRQPEVLLACKSAQVFLAACFEHQLIVKMFHFQTKFHGRHKSSDQYLTGFAETFDKFFEVLQGIYGRLPTKGLQLRIETATDLNIGQHLAQFRRLLVRLPLPDTELLNIRDEMLGLLDRFAYLVTFV